MKAKKLPSGNWRVLVYDYTDAAGKPIEVDYSLCDETALELPLSRADRPGGWDERVLPHLGFEILAERVFRPQLLLPLGEARGYYTEFFIAAVKTANGA